MGSLPLDFVRVSQENFSGFKDLLDQQAAHHGDQFSGSEQRLLQDITMPDIPVDVTMAWDVAEQRAKGYIMHNRISSLKGTGVYIEDIVVDGKTRSGGIGSQLFNAIKQHAREAGADYVSWVVDQKNRRAIDFYERKQSAVLQPLNAYDCTDALHTSFNAASNGVKTMEITAANLTEFNSLLLRPDTRITVQECTNIQRAAVARDVLVMAALSSQDEPLGLTIANPNYSSFRTVFGYEIEFKELSPHDSLALLGLKSATNTTIDRAKRIGYTGHMQAFSAQNSLVQSELMRQLKATHLTLTDQPDSKALAYAIGSNVIYPDPALSV